jgi:hypothetical protein
VLDLRSLILDGISLGDRCIIKVDDASFVVGPGFHLHPLCCLAWYGLGRSGEVIREVIVVIVPIGSEGVHIIDSL